VPYHADVALEQHPAAKERVREKREGEGREAERR
jgi:hypothetical protein